MHRLKHILCLYLSVAVMLCSVVAVFGTEGFALLGSNDEKNEVFSEIKEETSSPAEEKDAEEDNPEEELPPEEAASEEAVIITENSVAHEAPSLPSETDSYQEEAFDSAVADEAVTETLVQKEYHNSYAPGGNHEKVSPLYLLSETIGALTNEKSVNVYTFTVSSRSVFSYTVTHDAPAGLEGWKFSLYGEYYPDGDEGRKEYRLLDQLNTTLSTVDSSVEIGLIPGNYRLVVTMGQAFDSKQYRIDSVLKESSEYEIECNDNIYRYTEIYSGVTVKGSASSFPDRQDDDYYLFRMYNDGFVELKFQHSTVKDKVSVCWQVLILAEDGTVVYSVNSLFTDETNKSGKIGLVAGNYYVLVRNRVYTDMTYKLTLSRTDNSDFENEKNDTPETADILTFGTTITGNIASQISGLDRDYFRFTVENSGYCKIEFAHEPVADEDDKKGWNILLIDENGNVLYEGVSAWADDVTVSSQIGLGKGDYYVRIDCEKLYINYDKYYLTVSFEENNDWETEYNNTIEASDILTENTYVSGIISEFETDYDFDYYAIDVWEASPLVIEFSHEGISSHKEIFNITLYDSNKNAVSTADGDSIVSSYSDEKTVTAKYNTVPAGRYYIRVSSGIFYSNIKYSLKYSKGE